jgi:hypothetical protein
MNDLMKKKHHLRLIELEESVLISQVRKTEWIMYFCFYKKARSR